MIGQTTNHKMKKKIKKINNIFFKLLLLNIFLFSPSIGLSKGFNYMKKLNPESSANLLKSLVLDLPSFDYLKPLKKKSNKIGKELREKQLIQNEEKQENALDDSVSSRIRFAAHIAKEPHTIQYLHSSGLGIAYNVIKLDHIDAPESGGVGYSKKKVYMITPSYTFFFNNFSIGFGYSGKSGEKTTIWGCPSDHVCYDDVVELSTIELKQFLISYDIFENYELITGLSFLSYEYGGYDYSDENDLTNDDDYNVDSKEINLKQLINIGLGYKF